MITMNERAMIVANELETNANRYRVNVSRVGGAHIIDCGGAVIGGLSTGLLLARACMADLGEVTISPSAIADIPLPIVQVRADDPVRACLASQYAGWQLTTNDFSGMGSGPMRAAAAREEIFQTIPGREQPPCAVGVLESRKHPTEELVSHIVGRMPASVEKLSLLVAPASSMAGTIQVVARSLETALHKLHELKFDVTQVLSGFGVAPLPPVARDELTAIGRTNDAILYGGRVTLWVRTDDEIIEQIGPKVPSCSSKDHGSLFAELFKRYGDFYKIDPLLFSPAEVTFINLKTGRCHSFGKLEPKLLMKSFCEH